MFRSNRTTATLVLATLFWLLRRGPIGLGIAALLVLATGVALQLRVNQLDARNAAALAAGPPEMIEIADATPASGANGVNEVVLKTELVWDLTYDLWYEESSRTDYVAMFPLVAAGSSDTKEILGYALFQADDDSFETLTPETVKMWLVGEGDLGPIMNLNGALRSPGKWQELVEDSFLQEGIAMPTDPIVIWPYVKGREDALAPADFGGFTIFGILSKVAGAIGLLALLKLAFTNKREDAPEVQDQHDTSAAYDVTPQSSAAPLWKQRSGLVEDEYAPESASFEPAHFDTPPVRETASAALPNVTQRSGFGVRKVLIGIVGGLFILGLFSTVSGLIEKPSPVDVAQVQTIEELVAETAAAAIVPDADPNRHWTDIDVSFIVEWFIAKGLLAVSGDVNAIMTMGMIGFVLTILPIAIRLYFMSRRRRVMPRISTGMDVFS